MKYLPIFGIAPLTKKPEGSGHEIVSLVFARFFFLLNNFSSALYNLNVVAISAMGDLKVIQKTYEDFDVASCHLGHTHNFGSKVEFL